MKYDVIIKRKFFSEHETVVLERIGFKFVRCNCSKSKPFKKLENGYIEWIDESNLDMILPEFNVSAIHFTEHVIELRN